MRLFRFILFAATLMFGSAVAPAQVNAQTGLEITCWKREERQRVACGPSPLQMENRFKIGDSEFMLVGNVTITNRTNKYRTLEVVGVSPAYDPDNPDQPFWFGSVEPKQDVHIKPGGKLSLQPTFNGRTRHRQSYDRGTWVAPGTYEGTMIVRDKTGGEEYRFTMTIFAYKPGSN